MYRKCILCRCCSLSVDSFVTLDQKSYWSPSFTLLLQKGQQSPGTLLYRWALCPFSFLTSFFISSSQSPSSRLPPLTYLVSSLIHSLSHFLFFSLASLSLHIFSLFLSVPSVSFLSCSNSRGEWVDLTEWKVGRDKCWCHACWVLRDVACCNKFCSIMMQHNFKACSSLYFYRVQIFQGWCYVGDFAGWFELVF